MEIKKPTLLLNEERVRNNIKRMAEKAKKNNIIFRPHFKTHQSIEIGNWFKDYDVKAITVSSVTMAQYFASSGWNDITIAFPVNILEVNEINDLTSRINLNIIVVDYEPIPFLLQSIKNKLGLFLKIDTGTLRTGMNPKNEDEIKKIIDSLKNSKYIKFKGFVAHTGHTYQARGLEQVRKITADAAEIFSQLKNEFGNDCIISIGDTPACSMLDSFFGADEIRPGNFVFYDITQLTIGSCSEEDIAVALVAPIVVKHHDRNEIVLYGGAVHLSKDFVVNNDNVKVFGYVAEMEEKGKGWGKIIKNAYLKSMSQEHGIIKVSSSSDPLMSKKIGDLLVVLPAHSCLTADVMGAYRTLDEKTITMMPLYR
jgi:D-serine deaminase-like pyridoxal phosphate-dependent protein